MSDEMLRVSMIDETALTESQRLVVSLQATKLSDEIPQLRYSFGLVPALLDH